MAPCTWWPCHGLSYPQGALPVAVKYPGCPVLCRDRYRSPGALSPVYHHPQRRLCRNLHGRQGPAHGQHLNRTPLAFAQVPRCLPARALTRLPSPAAHRPVDECLQHPKALENFTPADAYEKGMLLELQAEPHRSPALCPLHRNRMRCETGLPRHDPSKEYTFFLPPNCPTKWNHLRLNDNLPR